MSGAERGKGAARAGRGRAKERMDGDVERIEAAFRDAGVTGCLHALDVDSGREVGLRSDEPVVLASVFKVPLLVSRMLPENSSLASPVAWMVDR